MSIQLVRSDRLLARYRRTGDPHALGLLFDRAAPELLRVAAWLCGNRTDAEDLLQRTFLTVIETRAAFDPSRRALPWLCGILGNHARKLHEQRQRRAEAVSERSGERDPLHAAADAEFAASVAQVRAEIGAPYAAVLDLHLAEGLNAKDIAARLGRPAGTVRTQLVRALDLLRRRLPSGFAAGLALTASATSASLATVRAAVVGRATALAPAAGAAATAFTFGGLLVGKKIAVVIPALALLLGGGAWQMLRTGDAAFANPEPVRPEVANAPAAAVERDAAAAPGMVTRDAVAAAGGMAADPDTATLVVHVTWQHDGTHAANVGVTAMPVRPKVMPQEREGITGADGQVVLRGIRPGPCWLTTAFSPMQVLDLAPSTVTTVDLSATRDGVVSGTVVDEHERPIAGARLWLSDAGGWSRGFEVARSADDGRFELPVRGSQHLGARRSGYAPSRLRLLAPIPAERLTVRLPSLGGAVLGRVFGADGEPMAGALVQVGGRGGLGVAGSTLQERYLEPTPELLRTDPLGAFVADGIATGTTNVRAWAAGHGEVARQVTVEAGRTSDVALTLTRGAAIEGTVRDEQQRPVANVFVGIGSHGGFGSVDTESDANGSFRLDHLSRGAVEIRAVLNLTAAQATLQLVPGEVATWNPVLAAPSRLIGTLVDPDGRPVAGFRVETFADGSQLKDATTDEAGRFELVGVLRPTVDLVVSVRGMGIAERKAVRTDVADLVIRLTDAELPSATIRGRVVGDDGSPIAASLSMMHAVSSWAIREQTAADGTFRRGPLPAGEYLLSVSANGFGTIDLPGVRIAPHEVCTVPDVVLAPAGRVELRLRGGDMPQGSLIRFARDDGAGTVGKAVDGKLVSGELTRGAWTAIATLGDTAGAVSFVVRSKETVRAELVLSPAASVDVEYRGLVALPGERLQTVVRDAAGNVVDAINMDFRVQRATGPIRARTWLPPGPCRFDARHSDGRVATVTFTIGPASDKPLLVVIELPAK